MKQIFTLLTVFVLISGIAQAQARITLVRNNSNWSNTNSWDLNRIPKDRDTVVIPAGFNVYFDKNESLGSLYVKVYGILTLKKNLILDLFSVVEVALNGQIVAFGSDRNNETIKIGSKKKFDQNTIGAVTGASYANNGTGTSPNGFTYTTTLPVKFAGFTAVKKMDAIVLNWSTAQESDNSHFEVEKSTDGRNWNMIAMVMGNGNTNTVSNYQYTDKKNNSAVVYYRIRQVDLNGKAWFTDVRTIRGNGTAPAFKVYASGTNELTIALNSTVARLEVSVFTLDGQKVAAGTYTNAAYQVKQQMPVLPAGMYVVQLNDNNGTVLAQKIVR